MKRIMMNKYGFVRWPEADFTDDGNRFTCYKVGKQVRVSKLVADGQVYLSISSDCGNRTLPFEIYSKLAHYNDANWKWNGVLVSNLTDQDLEDFYNACVLYEQEYEAAEANLQYPTLEELEDKALELYNAVNQEVNEIRAIFMRYSLDLALKLSKYEWQSCQEYLVNLMRELDRNDPAIIPEKIHKTSYSFDYMKRQNKESYWYRCLKDLFNRHGMKI